MPRLSVLFAASIAFSLAAAPGGVARAETTDGPAFDCAAATGEVEKAICADPALATLDRGLAARYAAATDAADRLGAGAEKERERLAADQRAWIAGRDGCSAAADRNACIRGQYLRRDGDLVARYRLMTPERTVAYACTGDPSGTLTAAFFATELPAVRLDYGDSTDTGYKVAADDGLRYDASLGRFIRIDGNRATVAWDDGKEMHCVAGE